MNAETTYGLEEAGMVQLDDAVGALMKALDDMGGANNTISVFSTDNGAETFTWPDDRVFIMLRRQSPQRRPLDALEQIPPDNPKRGARGMGA